MNIINLNSKNIIIKIFFITLITIICGNAFARLKPLELPRGCHNEGYTYHHKALTLLPAKAGNSDSVYFIYNKSPSTVNLYQLKTADEHMGININNKIRPYSWGVYSSNESMVKFACSTPSDKYDHGKLVGCQQTLKVCEYTNVKYGLNNRGNYWMSRSDTKSNSLRRVNKIGVLLSN